MPIDCKRRRCRRPIPDPSVRCGNSSNSPLLPCNNRLVDKISLSKLRLTSVLPSASISIPHKAFIGPGERDWSILPTDVLLVILGRLPVRDYLRFGAVCVSWNRAAATRLVSPAPPLPWLMVNPMSNGLSLFMAMFNPFTGKEEYRIKLHPHERYINSTSHGFIIYTRKNMEMLIMNPLTRSRISHLPSTATLTDIPNSGRCHITHAALLHRQHTTVVAVAYCFGRNYQLAFSRPGDDRWKLLADSAFIYSMIFHKDRLYVLHQHRGTFIWDFGGGRPPRPMPTLARIVADPKVVKIFLVESSTGDDLFQIQTSAYGDHVIFKLQLHPSTGIPCWCRVVGLSGDDALMLSQTRAVCVSSRDFPVLRRNCIYSTLNWIPPFEVGYKRNFSAALHNTPLRVYNLANGTVESLSLGRYDADNVRYWFTPYLS